MINIKEACGYAKYLDRLIGELRGLIANKNNFTIKTEDHLKSKTNTDAADEKIIPEVDRIPCNIKDIVFMIEDVINHKLQLALAIDYAKNTKLLDWEEDGKKLTLDAAIEYNSRIREFAKEAYSNSTLQYLINQKPSLVKCNGTGYKFNVDGNQTSYTYPVEVKMELDYNKDTIKNLQKKLLTKADKISVLIDNAKTENIVDFEIKYSIHDSAEDFIANYLEATKDNN